MRLAHGPQDIPPGKHFAVIVFDKGEYYVPPIIGHGYDSPGSIGSTEQYDRVEYWVSENRADWEKKISALETNPSVGYKNKVKYAAIIVSGKATARVIVRTEVDDPNA